MEEYSHNLEKSLEDLEMEVETLNAMMNELLRRVRKEKDRGLQTLPEVEEWISMAEDIESKASSLLDESILQCHDLSKYDDCSKISESTHHYSEMVCMTLKEVKAVRSEGVFKELVERAPLSRVKKMLPLQPIHSREMLLEEAWKCLAENECRTLGLYGMAGVGKTTLLTRIKNKFIQDGYVSTSVVLFVVVESDEVEGIQDAIMEKLGLYMGRKDQEEKAFVIFEILNLKRFVLLLDGIQRKVDLEEIGVPEPTRRNGCKVVFTTRSQEICKSMRVDTEVQVKCLSPEEAWDFFQEVVGETTLKSHPDIPQLARIVARKCGGLPITLSLIGETMSRKRTVREWHHAIHVLVSSTTGMEAELPPIMKFSYDNLPGENIRSCFLYCALFPKNCDINKQDLVDSWIAEGMIEEEEDREIAEIQGYEMMGDLVRMRLLMNNESGYGVKMHGMVREMALCIASDFGRQKENFVVVGGVGIHQMPEVNDWRIVRRMSVTSTHVEKISDCPDCPDLTTLFLQENNLKWVSGDFFRWMTSLVVLNLSRNRELSELPEEVSSLVSLRLLNLSWTWIKRLPLGLKELKRLIHLDLDDTPLLREIDVISYLLNLQVLRLFRSVPMDLSLMEDIQLLKSLKDLSLTVREVVVLKRLLSNHRLATCIGRLHLTGIRITDGGILLLNLRELDIGMCNWRSTIQRETVHFGNIDKIPHLQNIRTVTLSWCRGVRDLTWLLLAPNLGNLTLHECRQIEQIINKEKATVDMSEQPFQNLTRLSLDSLPRLESIYWTTLPFPVLEYLYIRGCPKLRRHQFNSNFDQEWIKGVESEKKAPKQHFSHFDDRDFPKKIAEDQKMDGLAYESHPIESIVPLETSKSGKSTTGEKVFQSGTDATVEHTQTHRVLTPDAMIIDTPGCHQRNTKDHWGGLDSFQRQVAERFIDLNASGSEDLLSLEWVGKLLDSFLCCHEEFRAIVFNDLSLITKPPMDLLIADYFDRSVKALDVCNAIRDGVEQIRQWQKLIEIIFCAFNGGSGGKTPLKEGQFRRAKKTLIKLAIGMLDDKESSSTLGSQHRNRSFGRNKEHLHHRTIGHFRPLSWSVSRSWSASKQLQGIGNNLAAPQTVDVIATSGLAVSVYTMTSVLLFVMWALVAAIPCQDGGLQVHLNVPKNFQWGGSLMSLHDRIIEESKNRETKNSCGLLKEINQIERSSRLMNELADSVQFPLSDEKEIEVKERVEELAQLQEALKNGLDPFEKKVSEVFHRIVRGRTVGLDYVAQHTDLIISSTKGFNNPRLEPASLNQKI